MPPQIIFGTATFGMSTTTSAFTDRASLTNLFPTLHALGVTRLDTAARYPPLNPGRSEQLIGETKAANATFRIDTKVYMDVTKDGSGDLSREAVERSVSASLERLGRVREGIDVLYVHRADPETPLAEQIRAFNEQIEKGRCKAWGLSNVPVPMLEEMLRICDEENLQKPVCYQGDYNIMTRGMETTLLPLPRKHGMSFNAFRPLASGFLTTKALKGAHAGTRFDPTDAVGARMRNLFGGDAIRNALLKFDAAVAAEGLSTLETAARWVVHHSALRDGDGVIFGASRESQVVETLQMVGKGALERTVLVAVEEVWEALKETRGGII